jgi:hypothetical protein
MNREFEALEHQLNRLRPARLPAPARQQILQEMQRPATSHGPSSWLWGHRTGFQVALAGACSLVAVVGLHWLSLSRRPASTRVDQAGIATGNELSPSLALLEAKLAATPPIGHNTVAALCSPSILTNFQNGR